MIDSLGGEAGKRRGREDELGILAEAHRLIARPLRHAPARHLRVRALEPPHDLVEVVAVRLARERVQKHYRIGLLPHAGTQRLISPRVSERSTTSTKELMDT